MAIIPKILDPVQGLIDYTLAIKPYHTKIIEVLEEYIHTDFIYVTMEDRLDWCINFGIPNLNTLFAYDIINVNFGNNSILVTGRVAELIHTGQRVSIDFSAHNNGFYYVTETIFNELQNTSEVFFRDNIPSDLADGKLVNSVIQYCPFKNDKSTNVLVIPPIFCDDGYGNIYDSFVELVFQINLAGNEIVIGGDHTLELSNTTTVQLINDQLYDELTDSGDIVGTFHIDSYAYNGSETVIKVIEDISTFPAFNINDSYKLLITYLGYDEVIRCNLTNDPNASETLFVTMKEEFKLDVAMVYADNFTVYNLENSYESKYDSIGFGQIVSAIAPPIPETLIQPLNPNVYDLWYDLNVNVLKQWHNYNWVAIKYVYWYQEDPLDNQNVTHYKLIKNNFEDTGWFEVDPLLNDNLSAGFDQEPFSAIKHNYFHDGVQIQVDGNLNGLFLYGGDFSPLLIHNLSIRSYDENAYIGNIHHAVYKIEAYATNTITLAPNVGDLSNLFIDGISFKVEDPTLVNTSFNVTSSTFDGINTIITVDEPVAHNSFNDTVIGTIPAVFYVQDKTFNNNTINGGDFDSEPVGEVGGGDFNTVFANTIFGGTFQEHFAIIEGISTLIILDQPMNPDIQLIEYNYNGPLHLTIDMFPNSGLNADLDDSLIMNGLLDFDGDTSSGDQMETTITDEIAWSWGNIIDWFQYYIISFPNVNEILVAGNATVDIQVGQQFRIIGNTPNAGVYSVSVTSFGGTNTVVTINEIIDPLELGGYIEPVDILPIRIILEDTIAVSTIEETSGGLLDTSGNLIESQDFKYFDVGGYDFPTDPNNIN